ncbi:MAG: hypothetical protein AB7U29_12205 [Desulfobulbus sp.]
MSVYELLSIPVSLAIKVLERIVVILYKMDELRLEWLSRADWTFAGNFFRAVVGFVGWRSGFSIAMVSGVSEMDTLDVVRVRQVGLRLKAM